MAENTSLVLRIAVIPILLVAILEKRYFFASFLFICFLVFFLLADIASLLRGKWRDFLLVLTSLLFGLCLIEGAANIWLPKQLTVVSPNGLFAPRSVVGWGPERAGRFHAEKTDLKSGALVYSVDYTIDSNLLRHTRSCETGPTFVFFGCSFTFGEGVNDADTLPQAFADTLDRKERVLNLGYSGYGPQQFLSEMQSGIFDPVIGSRPRLFVFLTTAEHAERTACKPYWARHAPRYTLENGQLLLKGACREGFSLWLAECLETSATYRWLIEPHVRMLSHDDVDRYIRIVLAAINLAREKYGVPTIVLYFNYNEPWDYLRGTGFSDNVIMQRLKDGGASVIDVSLDKEEAAGAPIKIPGDGHFTPLANRIRASMLKSYLEQSMPETLTPGL